MQLDRRQFTVAMVASLAGGAQPASRQESSSDGEHKMFGLMGKMTATPGQRDVLIAVLLEGTGGMPGCLIYIVAKDAKDENALWITEVWDSQESHAASLKLPSVQAAIAKGRPMIAGFSDFVTTEPVGGIGLSK
jgi:quinol monooxygenase YgiN